MIPTIHVVTPCLNTRESIDRTILSVITQAGRFFIRYHVQDGGSTDGNWERVQYWQRLVAGDGFPVQCDGIDFTCAQEADVGMYDAIIKGYGHMHPGAHDWLTWINADDILMPGACAFIADVNRQFQPEQVSWVGGSACVANHDHPIISYDRLIPTEVVGGGLCDGIHWDFVQQEGTFYRKWLWDSAAPEKSIRNMRVGGDWNLWRLFARRASLVQWSAPLGCFSITPGQLSARHRETYNAEMDGEVPREARAAVLETLAARGFVARRRFKCQYPDGQLSVVDEPRADIVQERYKRLTGKDAPATRDKPAEKTIHVGRIGKVAQSLPKLAEVVTRRDGIIACDHGWQFPAITEEHAYRRIAASVRIPKGVVYVAYPWATLIDKLQCKAKDAQVHLRRFRDFCKLLPKDAIKVTVCQQIFMRRFINLFEEAGIDHVFWSHATPADCAAALAGKARPAVHAFPLYPVQVESALTVAAAETDGLPRAQLFSFIGARPDRHYPRQTRGFILDLLADDKRGFVAGREGWFYEKVVYTHQIGQTAKDAPAASMIEQDQAQQFREVLADSIFSLCPAGTGPNSIRLWESLGAGAIPVILADDWAPPGDRALWEAAAVFRPETEAAVRALPDELAEMARDPALLAAKRQAMRQLWLLYGPDDFVHDICKLMQRLGAQAKAEADPLADLATTVDPAGAISPDIARAALTTLSWALLSGGEAREALRDKDHRLSRIAEAASAALDGSDAVRRHFEKARSWAAVAPAPALLRRAAPRVHYFGRHANRTPLSYQPFLREIPGRLDFVASPAEADVLLTGFNRDFHEAADEIARLAATNPGLKLLVLSEEPLWDTLWSGDFLSSQRQLGNGLGYRFVNHTNSTLFDFGHLPYFPLTDEDMIATYAMRIAAMAGCAAPDLLARWQSAPVRAAFFAERRAGKEFDKAVPDRDSFGLCNYRTEVAQNCQEAGAAVLCVGKGWREQPRRQELPNWHLDKLATLYQRTRVCSGIENTHQNNYISEKVFDPFVVGAIPAYLAGPRHRVREFVPPEAMINLHGLDSQAASRAILDFEPDLAFAEAWLETARSLARKFSDAGAVRAERRRFAEEALQAVLDLVDEGAQD